MGAPHPTDLEARSGIFFVRHGPAFPLVIRTEERRRKSDPTELSAPNGGLAVGFAQEWPLIGTMRLIDDGSECYFLDSRTVEARRYSL
jgi:hypothetical protein